MRDKTQKKQILIVGDEPDFLSLATFATEKLGYSVVTASSSRDALNLIREKKPDLVLMDIVLKGKIDGIETARQIRSDFNIPVVYVTACTDDKLIAKAKVTEPFGYIVKPLKDRELKIAVEIGLYKAEMEGRLKSLAKKLALSNQKLQASKASFRNIVEKNADGVIVVDKKGIVRFVNPAAELLFGKKAEVFLGEEFGIPRVTSKMVEIDIAHSGGENSTGEMRTIEIEWGSEPAYLMSIRDVTERKRAEEQRHESEMKFKTIFDSSRDAVMLLTLEEGFFDGNPATIEIFGCRDKTEFVSMSPADLSPEYQPDGKASAAKAQEMMKIAMERGSHFFEWVHKRVNGEEFFVDVLLTRMDWEGKPVLQATVRDITDRKRAEASLEGAKKELEATVAKLTLANLDLKDFVRIAAHDLKTPVSGIEKLAEWIITEYEDKFDKDGREQMKMLLARTKLMYNMIDGILQYSRVGRTEEKPTQVNLNQLVSEAIDMIAPPANVMITIENELPVIECEESGIREVFKNLIGNAVKYMDKPKGTIKINCLSEDACWQFSIADNGPGIEEKYFAKIFQIFQTLRPRDEFESLGVGLPIVKKIVELHGGQIWIESEPGMGSTFFFTLPKQNAETKNAKLQSNNAC